MKKKKTAKKKTAVSILQPTDRSELARLLGTAIRGRATIPAVGVVYEIAWEMRKGECFASLRVVSVSRKPNIGGLVSTTLR